MSSRLSLLLSVFLITGMSLLSASAVGEDSVWWKKKSLPEQIMTSASAVNMIVVACID